MSMIEVSENGVWRRGMVFRLYEGPHEKHAGAVVINPRYPLYVPTGDTITVLEVVFVRCRTCMASWHFPEDVGVPDVIEEHIEL